MMDAFVSDLASGLVRKLITLAAEEVIQAWNLQENLKTLHERLESIDALLSDADNEKISMNAVQNWLNKLKDVTHVADVFLDELSYEVTRKKVENHRKVKDFFHLSKNSLVSRFKVAGKIKDINTSFDDIFKRAGEIGLKPVEYFSSMSRQRSLLFEDTVPFEDEMMVVGRVNDASDLIKMLVRLKYKEDLPAIAITGMGGLGKTTLACLVYKSDYVINYFSKRMWVTVSDDFDFMRILNQMVESLTKKSSVLKNPEAVIKKLQEYLKGANFLLVLDDVWNKESRQWDKLRNSLLGVGGARGSKILITTRSQQAIDAMRSCLIYEVQSLSEDDSWALFKQRAFSHGGVLENDAFADMGRSMVRRCAGLPLAIKTLGGLLHSKRSVQDWMSIRDSEIWKSRDVLPSLRLSYDYLPYSSLKRCFAYCSILPKDSIIFKDELVQVWMALGFLLPPSGSNLVMEDIGNEYINILLWNSLLQYVVRDEYNNIISCKMHDLVHDLAMDVSKNHSVTVEATHELNHVSNAIHVRLEGVENMEPTIPKRNFERVQALYAGSRILGDMLPNVKHLHVLILDSDEVSSEWPSSLGKLKYLKYLDISSFQNYGSTLTSQITELYNLQTLKVREVQQLPDMLCTLINLRHLYIQKKYASTSGRFSGIEQLTCLQTLPPFVVSREEKCHLGQLGGLNNLRGELQLYCLREVTDIEEARKINLFGKPGVQRLELDWSDEREEKEYNDGDVMEALKPHSNLKELEIVYFQGKKFASWMMMMKNLVKVKFRNCNRSEEVPPLGHLPKLREIEINGMRNVKIIGREFYGSHTVGKTRDRAKTVMPIFPLLRKFILRNMPNLERWLEPTSSQGHEDEGTMLLFPKLEELIIQRCSKLKTVPSSCFQSLKELDIMNLKTSRILQTMSKKLSSLTTLRLRNVKGEGSSSSSDMDRILEEILRNNCMSLKSLLLNDCQGLTCLTLGSSNFALEELHVRDCANLISISVVKQSDTLKSLKQLVIMRCPSLVSLSDMLLNQSLQSTLVTLWLGPFSEELDEFPWPFSSSSSPVSFVNLKSLHLRGWSKLKSILPEQLLLHGDQLSSTFPALTSLRLNQFNGLEALPDSLGKLSSLKLLEIRDCKNLARLPTFEKSHSIRTLNISRCPVLLERCAEGSGPEWFKIQHIPNGELNPNFLPL